MSVVGNRAKVAHRRQGRAWKRRFGFDIAPTHEEGPEGHSTRIGLVRIRVLNKKGKARASLEIWGQPES